MFFYPQYGCHADFEVHSSTLTHVLCSADTLSASWSSSSLAWLANLTRQQADLQILFSDDYDVPNGEEI
jgi:hypothetical protein